MRLVGLTGAIGSGKSSVARFLTELGAFVIDADEVARKVTEDDPVTRTKIVTEFGKEFFRHDGTLDRRALGRYVFANPGARKILNAIVHPRTIEMIDTQIQECRQSNRWPLVVVEAPLIFEVGLEQKYRPIIVVDAPVDLIMARVNKRDGLGDEEIMNRLRSQMDPKEKVARADYVLKNDRSLEHLRQQVVKLYQHLTV